MNSLEYYSTVNAQCTNVTAICCLLPNTMEDVVSCPVPKSPAYVFGEYVLRPMLDKSIEVCSHTFGFFKRGVIYTDAIFSRTLNILPGAYAQEENDIGFVVASFSSKRPKNYLPCDGSMKSKAEYKELYEILKGQNPPQEKSDEFRLPNCIDYFLTGTEDPQEIGKPYAAMTALPKEAAFQVISGGAHIHVIDPSGWHEHQLDPAGEHGHIIDKSGEHTHNSSEEGAHTHTADMCQSHDHEIQEDGGHSHEIDRFGDHDHSSEGYNRLLHIPEDSMGVVKETAMGINKPNLALSKAIKPAGAHTHTMGKAGHHKHTMKGSGVHTHSINEVGKHGHVLSKEASHAHTASPIPAHSHKITPGGVHTHAFALSGDHSHAIIGGDAETKPRHIKVFYYIKAKHTNEPSECMIWKILPNIINRTIEIAGREALVALVASLGIGATITALVRKCYVRRDQRNIIMLRDLPR